MSNNFSIKLLTKRDVSQGLLDQSFLQNNTDIPFTPNKAEWLLQNTRAEDDDVYAVLAYNNNRLVSYVAFVPDYLKDTKGTIMKVSWCNRWWIADDYKESILATYTMTEALKSVKNQVVIKFLGKDVEAYYKKQPFSIFAERYRHFFVFSLDTDLLLMKFPVLKAVKRIISGLDYLSRSIIAYFNLKKIKKITSELHYEYIGKLDYALWFVLEPYLKADLVPKTKKIIDWQISNSQYQRIPIPKKYPYHCLVASATHQIFNLSFSVKKGGVVIGFISVLVRNEEYNVKYFIPFDGHFDECMGALIENFYSVGTSILYTENELLAEAIKSKFTATFVDKRKLYALKHDRVDLELNASIVNDQDGHYL